MHIITSIKMSGILEENNVIAQIQITLRLMAVTHYKQCYKHYDIEFSINLHDINFVKHTLLK
jgi:hypothetical protein